MHIYFLLMDIISFTVIYLTYPLFQDPLYPGNILLFDRIHSLPWKEKLFCKLNYFFFSAILYYKFPLLAKNAHGTIHREETKVQLPIKDPGSAFPTYYSGYFHYLITWSSPSGASPWKESLLWNCLHVDTWARTWSCLHVSTNDWEVNSASHFQNSHPLCTEIHHGCWGFSHHCHFHQKFQATGTTLKLLDLETPCKYNFAVFLNRLLKIDAC